MSNDIDSTSLGIVIATGLVCTILMLLTLRNLVRLRTRSTRTRPPASAQISELLEEQRSRMRHLVAVIGRDDLYAALMEADADRDRVLYSPEAKADMAQDGVSPEHVETVLAHPEKRSSIPQDFAFELQRDLGKRTLRVLIADPSPGFGPPYVQHVAWHQPSRRDRIVRAAHRRVGNRLRPSA